MENCDVLELMKKDRFVSHSGIALVEVSEGVAVAKMKVSDYHLNGLGVVQGGALFTLCDFTCAAAANSYGVPAVSLDGSIDFVSAVSNGMLTARATEVFLKRTIASYKAEVRNEEGKLVAIFHAKFFRKVV
jgi:acyl-CoA thioesterase